MRIWLPIVSSLTLVAVLSASANAVTYLKSEPPAGALKAGQTVYLDDGSCPAGRVRREKGGSDIGGLVGKADRGQRSSECVPRPR